MRRYYAKATAFLLAFVLMFGLVAVPVSASDALVPQIEFSQHEGFCSDLYDETLEFYLVLIIFCIECFEDEDGEWQARCYSPWHLIGLSEDPHWGIHNSIFGDSPTLRNDRYMPSIHAILQSSNLFVYTINNPIRFIDPTGRYIRILPNNEEWAVSYLFDSLQALTNDTLVMDDTGLVTISNRVSDDLITLAYGTQLLRNIIDNERNAIHLFHAPNERLATHRPTHNATTGRMMGIISVDLNRMREGRRFSTMGACGTPLWHTINLENDFHIIVAHELIHADRRFSGNRGRVGNMTNFFITPDGLDRERISLEESMTIGIGPNWGRYRITENRIRSEHGLNPRTSHRMWRMTR